MLSLEIVQDEVTPFLEVTVERLGDFTIPLTQILEDGLFSAQQQIVEGKGSEFGGAGWEPMAPSTVKSGRDPATLLVKSGALVASLTRGGSGNVFVVGPEEGYAGSDVFYGAFQQGGTSRIPARPFLVWYDERISDYEMLLMNWIATGEAVAATAA